MAIPNKVSTVITQQQVDTTNADIKKIDTEHPYTISLTPEARQALPKPGARSLDFINKCYNLAKQKPDFLPRSFSLEEMQKDISAYSMLDKINQPLSALAQKFNDTTTEVYAESYIAALKIYNLAQDAGEDLAGFEDVIDELAMRFARKSTPKPATIPAK
jgi:hypothetical protein